MYLGHVVEEGPSDELFARPRHPYTQALLSAVPIPDPERERSKLVQILEGDLPSPISPPSGCVFRTRCPKADVGCAAAFPELTSVAPTQRVACFKSLG